MVCRQVDNLVLMIALVAASFFLIWGGVQATQADNLVDNNVDPITMQVGTTNSDLKVKIVSNTAQSQSGDPELDCNANDGSPATVNLLISPPTGLTYTPNPLTFDYCGNPQKTITFAATIGGTYTITAEVIDTGEGGDSPTDVYHLEPFGTITVIVIDPNTAPLLVLPDPIFAEATGSEGATVIYSATSIDSEDDPDPTPICSPASGSLFILGTTTVECTVTDSGGLTATGSFDVTVKFGTDISNLSVEFDNSGIRYVTRGELVDTLAGEGISGQVVSLSDPQVPGLTSFTTNGITIIDPQGIHIRNCAIDVSFPASNPDTCVPDGGESAADPDGNGVNVLLVVHEGATIKFPRDVFAATISFQSMGSETVVLGSNPSPGSENEFEILTSPNVSGDLPTWTNDGLLEFLTNKAQYENLVALNQAGLRELVFESISGPGTAAISEIRAYGSNVEMLLLDANFEESSSLKTVQTDGSGDPTEILANGGSFYQEGVPEGAIGSASTITANADFDDLSDFFDATASVDYIVPSHALALGEQGITLYPDGGLSVYAILSYSSACDSDGDGLCNTWETGGIPYTWTDAAGSHSGSYSLCLPDGSCPDPNHKDIYVEIDYMKFHALSTTAVTNVINAFNIVPNDYFRTPNPDGLDGITLHVVQDEQLATHYDLMQVWADPSGAPDALLDDPQDIKASHFGTKAERDAAIAAGGDKLKKMLAAKANAYHWGLSGHGIGPGACGINSPSGNGEFNGNDFVITLGCGASGTVAGHSGTVGSVSQQSGTFMHELGHNLGLDHGGGHREWVGGAWVTVAAADYLNNCKVNYPSVMSYSKQFNSYGGWVLDYTGAPSNGKYSPITDSDFTEAAGTTPPPGSPVRILVWKDTIAAVVRTGSPGLGLDYNGDGDFLDRFTTAADAFPSMDPNNFGIGGCGAAADPYRTEISYNDWWNLQFHVGNGLLSVDGAPVPQFNEVESEIFEEIRVQAFAAGLDSEPPTINSVSVSPNSPDSDTTFIVISAEVLDPATDVNGNPAISTGVSSVTATLIGPKHLPAGDQVTVQVALELQQGNTYEATHTFTSEPDGIYELYIKAEDNALDAAGDPAPNSIEILSGTVLLDTTAPTVTGTPSRDGVELLTPDHDGWYNEPFTITWNCVDPFPDGLSELASGIASCDEPITYSAPDSETASVTGHGTDVAGNEGTTTFDFKYDGTAPTNVQVTGITDGSIFYFGDTIPTPGCSAAFDVSGQESCNVTVTPPSGPTAYGVYTLVATATDMAGNSASSPAISYTLNSWTLTGFYSPINMDSGGNRVINTVKPGSTVPLKFDIFIGSTKLTSLTYNNAVVGDLFSAKIDCVTGAVLQTPVRVDPSGGSSFRYTGVFDFEWKTPNDRNTCYDAIFRAQDGSTLVAHFKLK